MPKTVEYSIFRGSESGAIITETVKRTIQPNEALVEISHAGLCGADKLTKRKNIPLGHHGAGIVREVGCAVQHVKIGDRVGFNGSQIPCGNCDYCIGGKEQYCAQREHFEKVGSFATHAVWQENMLIKLPEGLESKYAAPLMCGGAIMWEVLTSNDVRPGDRIGVYGIGGLGHVAILMSSALGCDVVVFSNSESKRHDAMAIGAKEFHVTHDIVPETPVAPVQHLFWCRDGPPDFSKLLSQVSCSGTIYILAVGLETVSVPMHLVVKNGIRIQGCSNASRKTMRKMLQFVRLHDIQPWIMTWPMTADGVQDAFKALNESKMRYRGVLVGECGDQHNR